MSDPSPHEFYAAFLWVANAQQFRSITGSIEDPTKGFERIVPFIAEALGLRHGREHCFKLDAFFYREHVECFRPKDKWLKYISVALEHENDPKWSGEEIIKLQRVNTPLAALITYPPDKAEGEELLRMFATIIKDADVFGNASTQRRQMCVFGYPNLEWQGFFYEDGRFVEISASPQGAHLRQRAIAV